MSTNVERYTTHIAAWKWVIGVLAALAVAPFFTIAMGLVVAFLAPCGLAAVPVIGLTMLADPKPREPTRRAHPPRIRRLAVT